VQRYALGQLWHAKPRSLELNSQWSPFLRLTKLRKDFAGSAILFFRRSYVESTILPHMNQPSERLDARTGDNLVEGFFLAFIGYILLGSLPFHRPSMLYCSTGSAPSTVALKTFSSNPIVHNPSNPYQSQRRCKACPLDALDVTDVRPRMAFVTLLLLFVTTRIFKVPAESLSSKSTYSWRFLCYF